MGLLKGLNKWLDKESVWNNSWHIVKPSINVGCYCYGETNEVLFFMPAACHLYFNYLILIYSI